MAAVTSSMPGCPKAEELARNKALQRVFRRHHIEFAVLFGSHATGRAHAQSDIDVAVMPAPDSALDICMLTAEVTGALHSDMVDVVDLRRASPLLAWGVARDGRLLFGGPDSEWLRFRLKAMKMNDDAKIFAQWNLESIDRHLRKWGLR